MKSTYQNKDWDSLSAAAKAEVAKVAIQKGIYSLEGIKSMYNEFAMGGDTKKEDEVNPYSVSNLVDAIYQTNPKEKYLGEPEHHYDFTQSEEWANAHGYYPDARGHRDDRVKKPTHPSHPSRGVWDKDKFVLTDLGMQSPNYTMFGLVDGGQDPQAILTYKGGVVLPEITVTPQGNYFFNPYDNIELHTKAHDGLPPLSGALENIRQQSINKKAYGGYIHKGDATINKDNNIKEWAVNKDIHINNDGTITTRNGNTGSVILPDVNVYAQKDYDSAFDYSGANEVMGTIADFTPVVGDVKQGLEAANDLRKGNYTQAALGAGLLLLPNILEKPLKYASKSVKRLLGDTKFRFSKPEVNPHNFTDEQWDKLYDKAIQSKDIAEAQRLRDLHFMTKSNTVVSKNGTPIKTYHTISDSYPTNFTEFNPDIEGTHSAIYTSNNPIMSGTYSRKLINKEEKDYYINSAYNNLKHIIENPDSYSKELVYKAKGLLASKSKFKKYVFEKIPQLDTPLHPNRQKELYVKLNNPITIDNHGNNWNFITREGIPKEVNGKIYNRSVIDTGQLTTRDIERGLAQFDNYDGAVFNNITDYGPSWKSINTDKQVGSVYQIKSPNAVKLSSAITYDDANNIIPLSKRDNFKSKDIRYILPWGIISSSLGLANYISKNKD